MGKNAFHFVFLNTCKSNQKIVFDYISKSETPTPGIEPGPPGWKPGILAIRPRGIAMKVSAWLAYLYQ